MSGSYLDTQNAERETAEPPLRPVWEDEPDETARPTSRGTAQPTRPSGIGRAADPTWLPPDVLALLGPLCAAQDALARLDARAAAAPDPVRAGLNARIAFAEAAGWLAFAHAWVDPRDLALKQLGLTGSYAIATHVGRPLRDMPNTFARRATREWENQEIDGLLAGETAVATALTLARVLHRLGCGENPLRDFAHAAATLGQFAPDPLDGSRFAAWRSELQEKIGLVSDQTDAKRAGEGGEPALPPLLVAVQAAERWMAAGIVDIPNALQALLAAAGILVGSAAVRGVIPPLWSAYPALGRGPADGLPALRGGVSPRLPGTAPAPAWPLAFLHLLAEGARHAMRELDRLLAVAERGRGLVLGRDRRSQLPQALHAVLRVPVLTPKALAAQLQVAPQTATALLRELRAAGLVAEITGRRSFRAFAAVSG